VSSLGWIGVWLLVTGAVAIAAEAVLVGLWGFAFVKRSRLLAERIESERGLIEADLKRLQEALEETERLWQPYGRALRWLRHPLTIALLQSSAGRRAGR